MEKRDGVRVTAEEMALEGIDRQAKLQKSSFLNI